MDTLTISHDPLAGTTVVDVDGQAHTGPEPYGWAGALRTAELMAPGARTVVVRRRHLAVSL